MYDDIEEFGSPKVFTPNSCLSRELQEELNKKNMLTVKTRGKGEKTTTKTTKDGSPGNNQLIN